MVFRYCYIISYNLYVHHLYSKEFEETKGLIKISKSKKDRQHNGQKKKKQKHKQRSTKHTYKTKDYVMRTTLKSGVNSGAPEG